MSFDDIELVEASAPAPEPDPDPEPEPDPSPQPDPDPADLLVNGGFEEVDLAGWEDISPVGATARVVSDAAIVGRSSLRLEPGDGATARVEQIVAVEPGTEYVLEGRMRADFGNIFGILEWTPILDKPVPSM